MIIKAYRDKFERNYFTLVDRVGDEGCARVKLTDEHGIAYDERKIKYQLADIAVCVYGWHRPEIVIVDRA